jgi:hypothetical protein
MSHTNGQPPAHYITLIRAGNLRDFSYARAAAIGRKMKKGVFVDPWRVIYVDPVLFNQAADQHVAVYRFDDNYRASRREAL